MSAFDARRGRTGLIPKPTKVRAPGKRGLVWDSPRTDRALWTMQQHGGEFDAVHLADKASADWPEDGWSVRVAVADQKGNPPGATWGVCVRV